MAFRYKPRTAQAVEKRATQQGGDFLGFIGDDFKMYQSQKGDNFVRILPPTWDDAEHYGLDVWVHYNIGSDGGSLLCPIKMGHDTRCPICEASARAGRSGDDELKKELAPNKRVLVWMLDRKDAKLGPMIWSMPWTLDRDVARVSRDPQTGEIFMIDDPEEGYDISFEKSGEKITTKYGGVQIARRASSVDPDFIDFIVEFPLPSVLVYKEYDEIQKLFEGGGPPEDRGARDDKRGRNTSREEPRHDDRGRSPREDAPERDTRRSDPPRDDRRDDPPPRDRDPPRDAPRGDAGATAGRWRPGAKKDTPRDDEPPPPRDEDYGAREDDRRRDDPPPRDDRRDDPPPRDRDDRRDDPPPNKSGGASRAEELRQRFKR